MATKYRTEVYEPRLKAGQEYQDFVCVQLAKQGIVLQNLQTRRMQCERGENLQGWEIKLDTKLASTGRVFIETAERSDPAIETWTPSGIHRDDGSWLYLIGNYRELFIFCHTLLRLVEKPVRARKYHDCFPVPENDTATSQGFVISREKALKWAAKHIRFEEQPHADAD